MKEREIRNQTTAPGEKRKVVFVVDTLTDVRHLEAFSNLFDLILLTPEGLRTVTPDKGNFRFRHEVVPGGRVRFVVAGLRWLISNRHFYEVALVMDNLTAAAAANLAKFFTRRPTVLILGRPTVDYYSCRRYTDIWLPRFWVGLAIVKLMVRFNERFASMNLPVTQHMISQMKARRIKLVPAYGVDSRVFAPRWPKADVRKELDLPLDRQILLWRSRMAPEKDPMTFLRAAAILKSEGREICVLYVGGEYKEFLDLASQYDVTVVARAHVHPLNELPKYYCAADVVVQTSRTEGLAMSTLEALACEVPTVATAIGGMLETIRPNETGLNAPVGDVDGLARAIAFMLDRPPEASRMARAGREMVIEKYDTRISLEGYREAVEQVARARSQTAQKSQANTA